MNHYWVKFTDGQRGTITAASEAAARERAATIKPGVAVKACDVLPYPAEPRLHVEPYTLPDGSSMATPSFCYDPEQCKGRTSCPKRHACDD